MLSSNDIAILKNVYLPKYINVMANSTNIVDADVAGLYINNVRIAHITNVVLNVENDIRQIAGNSTVKEFIYGRDSWTCSSDGFVTFQSGYNWDYLMAMLDQYQFLTLAIPTNESGTEYLIGNALLQSNSLTAGNTGEMIKMSLQFQGSGPIQRVLLSYPLATTGIQNTADGAGCATSHPTIYYFNNNTDSYPKLEVGDFIYTDATLTTKLTGFPNKYIGIENDFGVAYYIDTHGEVQAKTISTCSAGQSF
jgi:hypothetical protein